MSFENNFINFSFGLIKTELINGVEKKHLSNLPHWKQIDRNYGYNGLNDELKSKATRTGKISGITVIDFDDRNVYDKLISEHPEQSLVIEGSEKSSTRCFFTVSVIHFRSIFAPR